jgi:hypothetical protein
MELQSVAIRPAQPRAVFEVMIAYATTIIRESYVIGRNPSPTIEPAPASGL